MIVNEDNTFDITENISVNFSQPRHGIFRKIPLRNNISRTDGSKSSNRAKITGIKINEKYSSSIEYDYKIIKIGDANKTVTGKHNYTIKYKYDIGKDPLKDVDELYFNLIGDDWDTIINKVTFKIVMPKDFDKSKLGFSTGNIGSTDNSNITYTLEENTITGNTLNALNPKQAVTVRLTLPEGYFKERFDIFYVYVIVLCGVFVLIADRLWAKYGKDDEVVETIEFYPPEGYNSAELAYMYKGSVDTREIISLLIYLADKGYLKIEEREIKGLFSTSKGFKLTKLKEYDGDNEIERIFFNGIFNVKGVNTVTASDLYNRFYTTLNIIKMKMNSKENKNRIFEPIASSKIKYLILMIVATFILIMAKPLIDYGGGAGLFSWLIYLSIFEVPIICGILSMNNKIAKIARSNG